MNRAADRMRCREGEKEGGERGRVEEMGDGVKEWERRVKGWMMEEGRKW